MADQSNSEPVVPLGPATEGVEREDQLDLPGQFFLSLLQKAAGLAEENSRYAVDIAQRLSHQLCAAENRVTELEDRIAELEAEVQLYPKNMNAPSSGLAKFPMKSKSGLLGAIVEANETRLRGMPRPTIKLKLIRIRTGTAGLSYRHRGANCVHPMPALGLLGGFKGPFLSPHMHSPPLAHRSVIVELRGALERMQGRFKAVLVSARAP